MEIEKRKEILEKVWTFNEAQEALLSINSLTVHGEWLNHPPTSVMNELAKAYNSHPAGIISQIQSRIINAFENKMTEMRKCLSDYVESDETNNYPENEYWLKIKENAINCLK